MRLPFALYLLGFVIAACSGATASPLTGDAGVTGRGASDAGGILDAPADAPAAVNGCTAADFAANDHTGAADPRVIRVPLDTTPAQFSPRCMRVKVDQVVTWQGNLIDHPLDVAVDPTADGGAALIGSLGTPDGSPQTDTLIATEPGILAFKCSAHPAIMFGALQVVP